MKSLKERVGVLRSIPFNVAPTLDELKLALDIMDEVLEEIVVKDLVTYDEDGCEVTGKGLLCIYCTVHDLINGYVNRFPNLDYQSKEVGLTPKQKDSLSCFFISPKKQTRWNDFY